MSGRIDVTEARRALIPALPDKRLPNAAARVYGSRGAGVI